MVNKSLMICCLMLTLLIAGPVFAGVYDALKKTKDEAKNISVSSFKNSESKLKKAYLNEIEDIDIILVVAEDETDIKCRNALYQDILKTVNSLISKSNGCIKNDKPDSEDWIVDCEVASKVITALKQLEADVKDLIQ